MTKERVSATAIELPLNSTDLLLVDLRGFDKYADAISDVFLEVKEGDEVLTSSDVEPLDDDGDGLFSFVLDGSYIAKPKTIQADWSWKTDRRGRVFDREATVDYFAFYHSPAYYSLSDEERSLARSVTARFADLYDNTDGLSRFNFFEQFQTSFGLNRIAEMMSYAVAYINSRMTPSTNYAVGDSRGARFPRKWYAVLELATYVEVLRHAVRSYVEQPSISGTTNIPFADRRDYLQRWSSVLEETKGSLESMIAAMRRDMLNLGASSTLVSGGIFGTLTMANFGALERGRVKNAYVPIVAKQI